MKYLLPLLLSALGITAIPAAGQVEDEEIMSSRQERQERRKMPAATYIFAVSPLHITEENTALGLSMEVFTNPNGIVSFYLPFSLSFAAPLDQYHQGYSYSGPYNAFPTTQGYYNSKPMLFFYPGVKIYPGGAFKKVSYAIGAHLAAGAGGLQEVTATYKMDSTSSGSGFHYMTKTGETSRDVSRLKLGVLVSNSLNLRPTKHLYIGFEFGIGYSYIDMIDGENTGSELMAQGGVKFGYVR